MPLSLESLGKLLKAEILTIGDVSLIQLNERYVLTENPVNKEVELNNLETYASTSLSTYDITDILDFKSIHLLKNYYQ
ncbi:MULTISPECIES: hypothetical protein [Olivibacter]|uniref:Uncharacterized protein n=1 Tax=Olivibacter jilunii TaxID=985016 RepID=A0ABW6B4R3_9SPHI|nr:hypothetical protein [Olivibacter sp. 47]MDM8176439.1 hypothetical protein [Olivibacter sp. 47]MDX3916098.1 hypothetical protein [Pseudosphingobacterium sp.]